MCDQRFVRLGFDQHEHAEQHHAGEQLQEAVDAVDQQAEHRVLRRWIYRDADALEQPQRAHHTENTQQDPPEVAAGHVQAFPHRRQGCQAPEDQQVFTEGQGHHQPQARQEVQRQSHQDQQRVEGRQQGKAWPQGEGRCEQVTGAWCFTAAAGVEKQDQRCGVQGVHQEPDDHAVAGETLGADGAVHALLQQGLEYDQRQAQLGDPAQMALEEIQRVAQHVKRIHESVSQFKSGLTL